jgi:hypothetical protein
MPSSQPRRTASSIVRPVTSSQRRLNQVQRFSASHIQIITDALSAIAANRCWLARNTAWDCFRAIAVLTTSAIKCRRFSASTGHRRG